eukprot:5414394-Prorocentrum_lima.AAC.1
MAGPARLDAEESLHPWRACQAQQQNHLQQMIYKQRVHKQHFSRPAYQDQGLYQDRQEGQPGQF